MDGYNNTPGPKTFASEQGSKEFVGRMILTAVDESVIVFLASLIRVALARENNG